MLAVGEDEPEPVLNSEIVHTDTEATGVQMLNYTQKGSYVQRERGSEHLPGAAHFSENPLYGMFKDQSGFYFHFEEQ